MENRPNNSVEHFGPYEISPIRKSHTAQLAELADQSVGNSYFNEEYFIDYLNNDHKWAMIYTYENVPIGYSLLEYTTTPEFIHALPSHQTEIQQELSGVNRIIIRRATSVHPDHRSKGIASDMVGRSFNQLPFRADVMLSIAWKSHKGVHMKTPLESNGFNPIIETHQFYAALSIKRNFSCPYCGKPPCKCNAVLYKKILG